jgi:hypothetical protein
VASQAIDAAVPPVPCDIRISGNLAGLCASSAFAAAGSASKIGAPGAPMRCGATCACASAGYHTVVTSARRPEPRQS